MEFLPRRNGGHIESRRFIFVQLCELNEHIDLVTKAYTKNTETLLGKVFFVFIVLLCVLSGHMI